MNSEVPHRDTAMIR